MLTARKTRSDQIGAAAAAAAAAAVPMGNDTKDTIR
jgi:hypothetical protein